MQTKLFASATQIIYLKGWWFESGQVLHRATTVSFDTGEAETLSPVPIGWFEREVESLGFVEITSNAINIGIRAALSSQLPCSPPQLLKVV